MKFQRHIGRAFHFIRSKATIIASAKETENGQSNDSEHCNYSNWLLLNSVIQWKNPHSHRAICPSFCHSTCTVCSMQALHTPHRAHIQLTSELWVENMKFRFLELLKLYFTFNFNFCVQHPTVRSFGAGHCFAHCSFYSFRRLRFAPCFFSVRPNSTIYKCIQVSFMSHPTSSCTTVLYIFHCTMTMLLCLLARVQCKWVLRSIVLLFWMVHSNNEILGRRTKRRDEELWLFQKISSDATADRKE